MSSLNEINKNRVLSISDKKKKERLKKALKKQTQSRQTIKTSEKNGREQ